jgi:hypothetical protein
MALTEGQLGELSKWRVASQGVTPGGEAPAGLLHALDSTAGELGCGGDMAAVRKFEQLPFHDAALGYVQRGSRNEVCGACLEASGFASEIAGPE